MVFPQTSSIVLSVAIQTAVVNGYGMHKADLTEDEQEAALKWLFIAQTHYRVTVCFNKVSVILLYLRISCLQDLPPRLLRCFVCRGRIRHRWHRRNHLAVRAHSGGMDQDNPRYLHRFGRLLGYLRRPEHRDRCHGPGPANCPRHEAPVEATGPHPALRSFYPRWLVSALKLPPTRLTSNITSPSSITVCSILRTTSL